MKKSLLIACCLILTSCGPINSESVSESPSNSNSNTPTNSESNLSTPSIEQSSTPEDSTIPSDTITPEDTTTPSGSTTPEDSSSIEDSSIPSVEPSYDTITIDQAIALTKQLAQGKKSSESYYIKGTVSEIWNATYGNLNFGPFNNQFTVYGSYSSDGSVPYADMIAKIAIGDEIVFYGQLYHFYNSSKGTTKYEVENAWIMSINGVAVNADGTLQGGSNNNDDSSSEEIVPINPGTQWTNDDFGNYYQNIDFSNNNTLLKQLQTLNSQKRKSTVGYDAMKTQFKYTDYDPNSSISYDSKGQPYSTQIIGFYTNRSATYSGNMNREHVWPNSRGGGAVDNDIHMTRPTFTADNSSRGNSFYVNNQINGGWDPAKHSGMIAQSRGYAARIIFYCVVASSNLALSDKENIANSESGYSNTMGKISDLLRWNLQYPVDITELNRNNGAQYLQGNRNPFIDNPYLACAIWGNFNAATREICKDYGVIVDPYTGDITLPDGSQTSSPSVEPSSPSENPSDDPSSPSDNPSDIPTTGGYYQKVTSEPTDWSGEYLIVYEGTNVVLDGSLASINTANNFKTVTISNNTIAWTKDLSNYSFSIEKYNNGYSILSSSGKYIGNESNSNGLISQSSALLNEISYSSSGINIISSGSYLRFNVGWPGFRYYKSSSYSNQKAIELYKYIAE